MTSKKPIYKKPFEPIDNYKESTWVGNSTPIFEDEHTAVFKDRYPCVDGHLLFIAKENTAEYIGRSYGGGKIESRKARWTGSTLDRTSASVQGRLYIGRTYISYLGKMETAKNQVA